MKRATEKRILVLGAGAYQRRVFDALAAAGFYVLAVDRNDEAGKAVRVDEFCPLDLSDGPAVLAWCRERRVDGVMALNELGVRTAAFVAEALNLPGPTTETARLATDKGFMRDRWAACNIPQPRYRVIATRLELDDAVAELGLPCVLKPTESGGGRGVSVLRQADDLEWAYAFAEPFVKNGRFIVEQFLDGTELTVETLSIHGETTVLAMSDKFKPELRTRVATSLNYPAALSHEIGEQVRQVVRRAVQALGIHLGMAHTEVIVTPDGPRLVETGARGGGGHIFHTLIQAVSGINAPVVTAQVLTGDDVVLPPLQQRGGVYRFLTAPNAGVLRAVRNLEQALSLDGVLDVGVTKKLGDRVGQLNNSLDRPGFVVTSGRDRAEAMAVADTVESMVRFEVSAE